MGYPTDQDFEEARRHRTPPAQRSPEPLTLAALRAANAVRQKEWDRGDVITLEYRGNELAGEVGEACNVVKKLARERLGIRGSRATAQQLAEELADVMICVDLVAMHAGIDLAAAVVAKFNLTSEKNGLATRLPFLEKQPSPSPHPEVPTRCPYCEARPFEVIDGSEEVAFMQCQNCKAKWPVPARPEVQSEDSAFKEGAEAMREAAVKAARAHGALHAIDDKVWARDCSTQIESDIRSLPLPEKPSPASEDSKSARWGRSADTTVWHRWLPGKVGDRVRYTVCDGEASGYFPGERPPGSPPLGSKICDGCLASELAPRDSKSAGREGGK